MTDANERLKLAEFSSLCCYFYLKSLNLTSTPTESMHPERSIIVEFFSANYGKSLVDYCFEQRLTTIVLRIEQRNMVNSSMMSNESFSATKGSQANFTF